MGRKSLYLDVTKTDAKIRSHYVSKADRAETERQARLRAYEASDQKTQTVCDILERYAIDVLEATGRGYTISAVPYARMIVNV